MSSARIRYEVAFCPQSEKEDLPEMNQFSFECREALEEALDGVRSRPHDGDPKTGLLRGTFSVSFWDGVSKKADKGRVVYSVRERRVTVWAAHPDHDEAYKRARSRYRAALKQ